MKVAYVTTAGKNPRVYVEVPRSKVEVNEREDVYRLKFTLPQAEELVKRINEETTKKGR